LIDDKKKKVRIDWYNVIDLNTLKIDRKLVNDETIKADFNDRLVSGEFESYDEYKDWVCGIDLQFRVVVVKESL
jgi:hypothetical protein